MYPCDCKHNPDPIKESSSRYYSKQTGKPLEGVYDHRNFEVRYSYANGYPRHVVTKIWLDSGDTTDLSHDWLAMPWETYPDMPERLKHKVKV